ncbi:hypothetical protein PRIPAC_72222, partial [Pristionchus pacificus]|uniref:Uncharacterized protein n=1 Tax=Pristionchus pacificus TaxID=54126 RepID=A0A2A6B4P2_PRIPA
ESDKAIGGSSSISRFVFTKDLEFFEDLQYGRMSFKGCNPQVEKLMKHFADKKNVAVRDSDDEKDVSDGEMAETLGRSCSRRGEFKRESMDQSLIDESAGEGKRRRVENVVI